MCPRHYSPLSSCVTRTDELPKAKLFVLALDGVGGARRLDPWDEDGIRDAFTLAKAGFDRAQTATPRITGVWIHSDFKCEQTRGWLRRVLGRRFAAQTTDWLTEDLNGAQPLCEPSPSSDALLLTLRAAKGLPTGFAKQGPKLVAFHLWVMRHLLVSATEAMPGEGAFLIPELEQSLLDGSGEVTAGALAALILERAMHVSISGAKEAEDIIFDLKERLQFLAMGSLASRELELLRRDLAQIRYNVVLLRRYLFPQQEPLESLMQFCTRREGRNLFSEKAISNCKKAQERHQALVECLDATRSAGEILQGELLALIQWGTASGSYRLTLLGSVLGVLGFFSVSFDLLNFMERRRLVSMKGSAVPLATST